MKYTTTKTNKPKLPQCLPAVWDVTEKYLKLTGNKQLAQLRKINPRISVNSIVMQRQSKTVTITGYFNTTKVFLLMADGEYYDGKKSLIKFLEEVYNNKPETPHQKLTVQII